MIQINLLTGRLLSGGRRIPLTQGQSTVVDDEDYDRLNQHRWHARWDPYVDSFYAARTICLENGKYTTQYMHREVLGLQSGDPRAGHHKNRSTLDNRRSNLETLTPSEHQHEHRDDPRKNQSKYGIGVSREKRTGRFEAKARIRGRRYHVGTFDTPEEAQKARRLYVGLKPGRAPSAEL